MNGQTDTKESLPETLSGRKWGKSQKRPTSRNKDLAESRNRISPLILVSWAFRRGLKKGGMKRRNRMSAAVILVLFGRGWVS